MKWNDDWTPKDENYLEKFEIKDWFNKKVIYSGEGKSLKDVVEQAVREGVSLKNADLRDADLKRAKLPHANFYGADLRGATLEYANLPHANLSKTNLGYVKLKFTNLYSADLKEAEISNAHFFSTFLENANLEYAILKNISFAETSLKNANIEDTKLISIRNYYKSREIILELLSRINVNSFTDEEHIIISKIRPYPGFWNAMTRDLESNDVLSLLNKLKESGYEEYLNKYNEFLLTKKEKQRNENNKNQLRRQSKRQSNGNRRNCNICK